MRKTTKLLLVALVLTLMPLKHWAQTPYRQYANDGIELNFTEIQNIDFRAFLLYNLTLDDRFVLIPEDENGVFNLSSSDDLSRKDFFNAFESFYQNTYTDFQQLSKMDIANMSPIWKAQVDPRYFASIIMDITLHRSRVNNDHCVEANAFCTEGGYYLYSANYSAGLSDEDADFWCVAPYNPSWFYMRIGVPGRFIIHIEGVDEYDNSTYRDVDFVIWGPYTEEQVHSDYACTHLTFDKIIDLSYSPSGPEDIYIGYPQNQHVHADTCNYGAINYHMPQTDEYYIFVITNYSRMPCQVTFYKKEGSGPGESNCSVTPQGVDDNSISKLNVYPNPAQDKINIESPNMKHIAVFNLLGVQIESKEVNDDYATIETDRLSSGTYILKVEYLDESVGYSRFVVAK